MERREQRPKIAVIWYVVSQVLATAVSTSNLTTHACGAYWLCNRTFVSAIHVPKEKRCVQNCKEPLYEICILKIRTDIQPSVTKKNRKV